MFYCGKWEVQKTFAEQTAACLMFACNAVPCVAEHSCRLEAFLVAEQSQGGLRYVKE